MVQSKSSDRTCSPSTMWPTGSPIVSAGVISRSAARATSTAASSISSAGSSIELLGNLAQHGCDLVAVRAFRVPAAPQVGADAVEQPHQVLDDDRHVVGRLAAELGQAGRRLEHTHGQRLGTALAVGDAEFELRARLDRHAGGQGRSVQEDLLAVIGTDEAKTLLLVVELDLAGRHVDLAGFRGAQECTSSGPSLFGPAPPRPVSLDCDHSKSADPRPDRTHPGIHGCRCGGSVYPRLPGRHHRPGDRDGGRRFRRRRVAPGRDAAVVRLADRVPAHHRAVGDRPSPQSRGTPERAVAPCSCSLRVFERSTTRPCAGPLRPARSLPWASATSSTSPRRSSNRPRSSAPWPTWTGQPLPSSRPPATSPPRMLRSRRSVNSPPACRAWAALPSPKPRPPLAPPNSTPSCSRCS